MDPNENSFQIHKIHGQFETMNTEAINMGRMAASCVELLHDHLGIKSERIAQLLNMPVETVNAITAMGSSTDPGMIPQSSQNAIHKLCAVQSLLLSGYTLSGMIKWFKSNLPMNSKSPVDILNSNDENAMSKVLQAAMGRMAA